jgi:hypothetical protein
MLNRFQNILFVSGIVISIGGIFLLIDDSMSGGWCPGNKWACEIKNALNGPLILLLGLALLSYPLLVIYRKSRKK